MKCILSFALIVFVTTHLLTINGYPNHNNYTGGVVGCIESEREALLQFKHNLTDPSNRLVSWSSARDCCLWDGVVCDNFTGHVRAILLSIPYVYYDEIKKHQLSGEVSPSLLNLKHLKHLDLSENDFGGIEIPTFFGSMKSLRSLNLSDAGFGGKIPHQLGNLSNLRYLNIRSYYSYHLYYSYDLYMESFHWLSGLHSLRYLNIGGVYSSKGQDWLQVTSTLRSLVELYMSDCDLPNVELLPHANFSSLTKLDLSGNFNNLNPSWIFEIRSLISLDLSHTNLKGSLIPIGFQNLTSLKYLGLRGNSLNSSLTDNWFYNLHKLESLNLAFNNFDGKIWNAIQNLTSLSSLDLSGNSLNSSPTDWIFNFDKLESLNLGSNKFDSKIWNFIQNLTSLSHLDLSNNHLEGGLTRPLGNLCNLKSVDLFSSSSLYSLQAESKQEKIFSNNFSNHLHEIPQNGNKATWQRLTSLLVICFLFQNGNKVLLHSNQSSTKTEPNQPS